MKRLDITDTQSISAMPEHDTNTLTRPSDRSAHILVADTSAQARRIAEFVLTDAGYRVSALAHPKHMVQIVGERRPDLVLLAIPAPEPQALEECGELRRLSSVPIVLLSAYASAEHKARGLCCGADDYLGTPYEPSELLARVAAILRRCRRQLHFPIARMRRGGLILETAAQRMSFADGRSITLTPIETRLLHYLMSNAGRLIALEEIALVLWDDDSPDTRVRVQVNVSRLRKKLTADQLSMPLTTFRGVGYCFEVEDDSKVLHRSASSMGNS